MSQTDLDIDAEAAAATHPIPAFTGADKVSSVTLRGTGYATDFVIAAAVRERTIREMLTAGFTAMYGALRESTDKGP